MARLQIHGERARRDYPANLRFCCDHYRSVSDLCRRVGINRQQFNRYLSGESLPSRWNHKRLPDFFGLEDDELMRPHAAFAASFGRRRREGRAPDELATYGYFMNNMAGPDSALLERYQGYYYRCFYNFAGDGSIKRELAHWRLRDGMMVSTTKQRLSDATGPDGRTRRRFLTYRGIVGSVGDRLFTLGSDRGSTRDLGMSIIYPGVRGERTLEGGMMGLGPTSARTIVSGRIVLEYLGRRIDGRAAMLGMGSFPRTTPRSLRR